MLDAVARYVKTAHRSVVLSIEPDWDLDSAQAQDLKHSAWQPTNNTILIGRTLILDLHRSEEELLAAMTKKTRQYIRKSGREELVYRRVERSELQQCLEVYRLTARRAGFGIHEDSYYLDIFENMGEDSPVFAAFHGGQGGRIPMAGHQRHHRLRAVRRDERCRQQPAGQFLAEMDGDNRP